MSSSKCNMVYKLCKIYELIDKTYVSAEIKQLESIFTSAKMIPYKNLPTWTQKYNIHNTYNKHVKYKNGTIFSLHQSDSNDYIISMLSTHSFRDLVWPRSTLVFLIKQRAFDAKANLKPTPKSAKYRRIWKTRVLLHTPIIIIIHFS